MGTKLKNKWAIDFMGVSLVTSIIGVIWIVGLTVHFLIQEWNRMMKFFTNVF